MIFGDTKKVQGKVILRANEFKEELSDLEIMNCTGWYFSSVLTKLEEFTRLMFHLRPELTAVEFWFGPMVVTRHVDAVVEPEPDEPYHDSEGY